VRAATAELETGIAPAARENKAQKLSANLKQGDFGLLDVKDLRNRFAKRLGAPLLPQKLLDLVHPLEHEGSGSISQVTNVHGLNHSPAKHLPGVALTRKKRTIDAEKWGMGLPEED